MHLRTLLSTPAQSSNAQRTEQPRGWNGPSQGQVSCVNPVQLGCLDESLVPRTHVLVLPGNDRQNSESTSEPEARRGKRVGYSIGAGPECSARKMRNACGHCRQGVLSVRVVPD